MKTRKRKYTGGHYIPPHRQRAPITPTTDDIEERYNMLHDEYDRLVGNLGAYKDAFEQTKEMYQIAIEKHTQLNQRLIDEANSGNELRKFIINLQKDNKELKSRYDELVNSFISGHPDKKIYDNMYVDLILMGDKYNDLKRKSRYEANDLREELEILTRSNKEEIAINRRLRQENMDLLSSH